MQIACSTSLFANLGNQAGVIEQACRCIQHAGLSHLVLDCSAAPIANPGGDSQQPDVVLKAINIWRSAAEACELRIVQLVSDELDSTDPLVANCGEQWITFAESMDVTSLVVPLHVPAMDQIGPAIGELLTLWAVRAGEAGVTISLGTPRSVAPDTQVMSRLMNTSRHSALRLDFDVGRYQQWHPHRSNEIALQRVVGSVGSLRLRDATGTPGEFTSPALGDGGAVDMARTCEIMKALNFRGPVVIEIDPSTSGESLPTIEAMLRDSVQHLSDCGWSV